jgi:pimeloyl-ACP methyl ester carboxylesterase
MSIITCDMKKRAMRLTRRRLLWGSAAAAAIGIFSTRGSESAKSAPVTGNTHLTAPTRFVEANGIRYAYRRFGSEAGTPLVFLPHFRAGMDHWDPTVTDGLAQGRPVVLFDNAGVASSSGETPDTHDAMGDHVAVFVNALRLSQVDVLGHSIGGIIAQSLVLRHPHLVRRLVLAGTGPRAGERVPATDPESGRLPKIRCRSARISCSCSFLRRIQVRPREGHFGNVVICARMPIRHRRCRR